MKSYGWIRGIALHILELHTRWRCVVNFTPQLLYPWDIFIAKYVCILLDGVFIHLLRIIMFKELRKEEYPRDRFS